MKKSKYIQTKKMEGDTAQATNLTIDFTGWTLDDALNYCIKPAVIEWQVKARKMVGDIPKVATYIPTKVGGSNVLTIEQQFSMLTPEQKVAMIEALTAKVATE